MITVTNQYELEQLAAIIYNSFLLPKVCCTPTTTTTSSGGSTSFELFTEDTISIVLTGKGTTTNKLKGFARISTDAGNALTLHTDGLYVATVIPGITSISADNGLNMSTATNTQLGGPLVLNTTITLVQHKLNVAEGANDLLLFDPTTNNEITYIRAYNPTNNGNAGEFFGGATVSSSQASIIANFNDTEQGAYVTAYATSGSSSLFYNVSGTGSQFFTGSIGPLVTLTGNTGAINAGQYGVGTFANTPEYLLGVLANGDVIEVDPGSVGQTYIFINGITETDGIVKLGGDLIEDTTINLDAFSLNITGTPGNIFTFNPDGSLIASQYGVGTFAGTPATYPAFDVTGNIIESATPYGITAITADNGLTASTSTNIQLGDTSAPGAALLHNSYIDAAAYTLYMNKAAAGNVFEVINTVGNGISVLTAGTALTGQSTSLPMWGINTDLTAGVSKVGLQLRRSGFVGSPGVGIAINFQNPNSATTPTQSGEIQCKLTTATALSEVSSFEFHLMDNGGASFNRKALLSGSGQWRWDKYGVGTFTGTAATYPAFTSNGTIIESATIIPLFTPANSTDATYPNGTLTVDDTNLYFRKSDGTWVKSTWVAF